MNNEKDKLKRYENDEYLEKNQRANKETKRRRKD